MTEKPVIFNGEMVRAILAGRKTQTRRLVPKWQLPRELAPVDYPDQQWMAVAQRHPRYGFGVFGATEDECAEQLDSSLCPFGEPGDQLWVRETFAFGLCTESTIAYRATHKPSDLDEGWDEVIKWTPSIHMPRWASRIKLEITGARVERLNAISEADALAEGMDDGMSDAAIAAGWFEKPQRAFQRLWEQLYGENSWASNPWVWVIEFKRAEC